MAIRRRDPALTADEASRLPSAGALIRGQLSP